MKKKVNKITKKVLIITISLIIVLLLLGIYFGYKGYNLYIYNMSNFTDQKYDQFIKGLQVKNTITVNSIKLNEEEYLTFNDIKIKNDFKEFKKVDNPNNSNDFVRYSLYDENEKSVAHIWMGKTETYTNIFKSNLDIFVDDKQFETTIKERVKLLEDNNITNDIELFKYITENKLSNNNIFTSIKDMKNNYAIQYLTLVALPTTDNITLINGDYIGYILNMKNGIKEINILTNNKRYVFTIIGKDYFTNEKINELLNTLTIN